MNFNKVKDEYLNKRIFTKLLITTICIILLLSIIYYQKNFSISSYRKEVLSSVYLEEIKIMNRDGITENLVVRDKLLKNIEGYNWYLYQKDIYVTKNDRIIYPKNVTGIIAKDAELLKDGELLNLNKSDLFLGEAFGNKSFNDKLTQSIEELFIGETTLINIRNYINNYNQFLKDYSD